MKCIQAQPILLDYSRGLLSPLESDAVKAHLEACPHCREMLSNEVRFAERLAAVPQVSPSKDVWSRVENRVRTERRPVWALGIAWTMFARRLAAGVAVFSIFAAILIAGAPWNTNSSEKNSIRQAAALMQVQPAVQQTDDQLTGTTDDMLKVIEDEL